MLLEDYTHKGKSKNCKPGLEDATFKEKHTDISMIKSLMRVWLKDLKKHIDSEMQVVINSATCCGKAFIHMNTWIAGKGFNETSLPEKTLQTSISNMQQEFRRISEYKI